MKLTKRQTQAINEIIQEEVDGILKGRALVSEHERRAKLFEEAAGAAQYEQARRKAEEAASLLSEVRDLLEHDRMLHKQAEDAFEAAYKLMNDCFDAAEASVDRYLDQ